MVRRMVLSLLMSGLVGEWSRVLGGILVAGKRFPVRDFFLFGDTFTFLSVWVPKRTSSSTSFITSSVASSVSYDRLLLVREEGRY